MAKTFSVQITYAVNMANDFHGNQKDLDQLAHHLIHPTHAICGYHKDSGTYSAILQWSVRWQAVHRDRDGESASAELYWQDTCRCVNTWQQADRADDQRQARYDWAERVHQKRGRLLRSNIMSSERIRSVVRDYRRHKNNEQALEEELQMLDSQEEFIEEEFVDDDMLDFIVDDSDFDDNSDQRAKAS